MSEKMAELADEQVDPTADEDEYDVNSEEPVIDDAVPTTWQEFAEDARTGPSAVVIERGDVTLPGAARLTE
ncbi:hypothetical protein [Nocardia sp. CA-135398]|uniref:hypothetical protein n=1 Tax=Nocardia sp. CA-135398 TaxID=3239977 RepID=UPI003D971B5F